MSDTTTTATLLVIDDDVFICDLVASLATDVGYAVTAANNQAELEEALRQRWDLVLLDLSFPDMDAVSIIQRLSEAQPGASVLLFSGATQPALQSAKSVATMYGLSVVGAYAKSQGINNLRLILEVVLSSTSQA